MICVSCRCAFLSSHAPMHVKSQHEIPVSKDQKQLWDFTILNWNVTMETHILLPVNCQPVELLKIHQNTYCCNICDYAALTTATFSKHWSLVHKTSDLHPSKQYHKGSVQTYYSYVPCIYFEITVPSLNFSSLFDVYIEKELPTYESFNVTIPSAP